MSLALLTGCVTERGVKELETQLRTAFAPFEEFQKSVSGAQELAYATAAFQRKNSRWPEDYAELSGFVQASDGLLVLNRYDKVDFIPAKDGGLEVAFLPEGQTNLVSFRFSPKDAETK